MNWSLDVADPISANEASTYAHAGKNYKLHNVVMGWRAGDSSNAEHLIERAGTLTCDHGQRGGILYPEFAPVCGTIADGAHHGGDLIPHVRRLTPRECERLQGFPDDYTLIPYRGKDAADGNRYKALGNSMAVNVMRWIGRRIQQFEQR